MFGKKKKASHTWRHNVLAGVDSARDWTAPKLAQAADWAEDAYRKGAPKVQDASQRVLHQASTGASAAGEKIRGYSSRAASAVGDQADKQYRRLSPQTKAQIDQARAKYDDAKHQVTHRYVPEASARLGDYADRTAKLIHKAEVDPRVEKALIKATGDKKIVKKLRKSSEKYAKDAAKSLKKQQRKQSRRKGLLVFGLVAAGVTAAVAAWRASQPVEDPWKKPQPVSAKSTDSTPIKPVETRTPAEQAPTSAAPAAPAAPKPAAGQAETKPVEKPAEKPAAPKAEESGQKNEGKDEGTATPKPKPAT